MDEPQASGWRLERLEYAAGGLLILLEEPRAGELGLGRPLLPSRTVQYYWATGDESGRHLLADGRGAWARQNRRTEGYAMMGRLNNAVAMIEHS